MNALTAPDGVVPAHVPAHRVRDFDFRFDPQIASKPWAYFASVRDAGPVFWTPRNGGHWIACGTEVLDEVFRRHDLFSNGVVSIPAPPRPQSIPSSLDPPEHGKFRKILSQRLFSPKALEATRVQMVAVMDQLCADLLPRGRCEFIADFARPLPVALVLGLMGLPFERRDDFCTWSRMISHGNSVEEHLEGYRQAHGFLGEWIGEQIALFGTDRESELAPFMRAMAEGRVDDRPVTREEMHSMAMLLMVAGVDTLTAQMGHAMLHFATHPDDARRLVEHPEVIPRAVEELMRRYGIANITRVAAQDMDYRGVAMRKGDLVLCASVMGGLDETVFADAMTVNFDRPAPAVHHTPFGAGPHICPGAWLARTLQRAMLERLLPAMPGLRVPDGASLSYASGVTIGLTSLPLAWDTAAA